MIPSFVLYYKISLQNFDKKTQFYTVTINHTNFENVPSELTAGYVYKFNVNLEEFDEDVCYFLISNNDSLKNYPYTFVRHIQTTSNLLCILDLAFLPLFELRLSFSFHQAPQM